MKHAGTIRSLLFGGLFMFSQTLVAGPNEELIAACMKGDLAGVTGALSSGADVNFMDANGSTPITSAFFWPDITSLLLEKGADPNKGSYPALLSACNNYSVEVVKLLLDAGADPNKTGITDPAVTFRTLIANEKAKGKNANQTVIKTWEGLIGSMKPTEVEPMRALVQQTNCVPCLKMFLGKGAKQELKDGNTALDVLASFSMSKDERKAAFAAGAPMVESFGYKIPDWYRSLPDDRNGTAIEMLDLLLQAGADPNRANTLGLTPLVVALRGCNATPAGKPGKLALVNGLLDKGADPKQPATQKFPKGEFTFHPICLAAEFGDVPMMTTILDKGADINTTTSTGSLSTYNGTWGGEGYTPLIIAIMVSNFDLAGFLLDKNADIKIGSSGFALLEISNSDQKATISTKNKTPIYWAIDRNNMDLIKRISDKMDWNFNPDFSFKAFEGDLVMQTGWGPLKLKGKTDLSPAMYADIIGNKEAKKYLLK